MHKLIFPGIGEKISKFSIDISINNIFINTYVSISLHIFAKVLYVTVATEAKRGWFVLTSIMRYFHSNESGNNKTNKR